MNAFYPISELYLFKQYTRKSYEEDLGFPPPTGDPTKPMKYWMDQGVTGIDQIYNFLDSKGKVQAMVLPHQQALSVNIPGYAPRIQYKPKPTQAVTVSPNRTSNPINPIELSTLEDAVRLRAALGGMLLNTADSQNIIWGMEERRIWALQFPDGSTHNIGLLLFQENAEGIGRHGHWTIVNGSPTWIADTLPVQSEDGPVVPMPIRPLLKNEAIAENKSIGGGFVVYRTDMESIYNPSPLAAAGGLTKDQAAQLTDIQQKLTELLSELKKGA